MMPNKLLIAAFFTAVTLMLCSCSESQDLSGRWIQDGGSSLKRILTIDEDVGFWDIDYTHSPKSHVDGTVLSNDDSLVFQLNNLVYLGEGHQRVKKSRNCQACPSG